MAQWKKQKNLNRNIVQRSVAKKSHGNLTTPTGNGTQLNTEVDSASTMKATLPNERSMEFK